MLKKTSEPELQIEQDLIYEKRKWVVERISWVIMSLVILAALLGLVGNGPLSSTSAANDSGSLSIDYDRFLHLQQSTTFRIHVAPGLITQETVALWFDEDFLSNFKLEKVIPQPERTELGKHRYTFVFPVSGEDNPFLVSFHVQPERAGFLSGSLGMGEAETVRFEQFVYP